MDWLFVKPAYVLQVLLQQCLNHCMHATQLLGDGVLRAVLLFRQPLDPPDLGEELADLLVYVPAILLGHGLCGSVFVKATIHFTLFVSGFHPAISQ